MLFQQTTGLDKGWIPQEIIGITEYNGVILHYVKWCNPSLQNELIPSEVLSKKYPQVVIDFYQKHIEFVRLSSEISLK
ncbi:hypothetical protein B4U79_18054 [Dinothrombium tinctorium]|nr:hypothetical protein B4U79_18054 [Dinothrombium tinctorium]